MNEASKRYESATRIEAITKFNRFCNRWKDIEKKAIRLFTKDFGKTLTLYDYSEDRRFISTTNHMGRELEGPRC
jgi:transposase-like protein